MRGTGHSRDAPALKLFSAALHTRSLSPKSSTCSTCPTWC